MSLVADLQSEAWKILRLASPVAAVNLCSCLLQLTELGVVGTVLGVDALASVCICSVVFNLALEPACFITANAVTTLCADALHKELSTARAYIKASVYFSLLVAVPIIALYLLTPHILALILGDNPLLAGVYIYAPASATAVAPSLLFSAMQGLMRARGLLHTAGLNGAVGVFVNLPSMLAAVRAYGLVGAGLCSCAVRTGLLILLAVGQRQFFSAPPSAYGLRRRHPLWDFIQLYAASLLPATLRLGSTPLLVIVAVALGCNAPQAASLSLAAFLLQTFLALCVGVQQASLMLTARYLHRAQPSATQLVMLIASLFLAALALLVGLVLLCSRRSLSLTFSKDETMAAEFEDVSKWIAPMLLFKSLSGLFGQSLAVMGRGRTGTVLLVIFPWCLGLPGAYILGKKVLLSLTGGQAAVEAALLQIQTAAWFATLIGFFISYLAYPPRSPTTPLSTNIRAKPVASPGAAAGAQSQSAPAAPAGPSALKEPLLPTTANQA